MELSIREHLAVAEKASLKGPATCDSKIAVGPSGLARRRTGDRLTDALGALFLPDRAPEVLDHLSSVRSELKAFDAEARAHLAAAEDIARALKGCCSYLDGEADMPRSVPAHVKAALASIRAARDAGFDVAPGLGGEIGHSADRALDRIKHLANVAELRRETAMIAYTKQGAAWLEKRADEVEDDDPARAGSWRRAAKRMGAQTRFHQDRFKSAQKSVRRGEVVQ